MNRNCVLRVEKLTKKYKLSKKKEICALNNISFEMTPGLYGLLGPNGAGKSTLINIITGGLQANKGKIFWNNKSIASLGKSFRQILGYMPQQQNLYEMFTGRYFLKYLCALKEIPSSETEIEISRVTDAVNMTKELDKRLSAYSGGMKQRLLAAVALLGNPELIILDEPTAGLDPKERVRFRNLIHSFSKDRVIIFATHVVSDVESVADKVMLLKKGQLVDFDTTNNLISKHASGAGLEDVYLNLFDEAED